MKANITYTSDNWHHAKDRIEDIPSLEYLLALVESESNELIISNYNITGKDFDFNIEVYDGYRE